jgi:hypothetical protein
MQIRIIIEHKYSSSYQKQIGSYREERKEGVFVSIFTDQERNTKISTTHPRLRVIGRINTGGKGIKKKIKQEEKRGGPAVIRKKMRDRDLDSYRVRYSKHGLMSRFKVDYELMSGC